MAAESEGRKIHAQALESQEGGNFQRALEQTDAAMIAYQRDGDSLGFSEIQAMRFLTLKHLFDKTGDRWFLILAKYSAMAGVELAEISGNSDALAIPLFNLAKVFDTLEEYPQAIETFKRAIDNMVNNPPDKQQRPAVIADMRNHLAVCEYKAGDMGGLERAEQAVDEIKMTDDDSYSKNVWISGGYMRMAEAINLSNEDLAMNLMSKAKNIIDSDKRLVLRLEQWERLKDKLTSSNRKA